MKTWFEPQAHGPRAYLSDSLPSALSHCLVGVVPALSNAVNRTRSCYQAEQRKVIKFIFLKSLALERSRTESRQDRITGSMEASIHALNRASSFICRTYTNSSRPSPHLKLCKPLLQGSGRCALCGGSFGLVRVVKFGSCRQHHTRSCNILFHYRPSTAEASQ